MMKLFCSFALVFVLPVFAYSQNESTPEIRWSFKDGTTNKVQFDVYNLPELEPIPGARKKPEVKYFWILGDGAYSTQESPIHVYDPFTYEPYEAELFLTYTYTDTGKDPKKKRRHQSIAVNNSNPTTETVANLESPFMKRKYKNNAVVIQTNQSAKAGESFVAILSYKNTESTAFNGQLDFYYNENNTCNKCFFMDENPRLYNGELHRAIGNVFDDKNTLVSTEMFFSNETTEATENSRFSSHESFQITNLESGKEAHAFIVLTTNEAMTDTSLTTHALLTLTDDYGKTIGEDEIEIELVSSHDPNRILAANNKGRMERIFVLPWKKKDSMTFRINFQNNGDGEAKEVRVVADLSDRLDTQSIEVKEAIIGQQKGIHEMDSTFRYQAYADSVVFYFKDIFLAGTGQSNAKKKDTKGHVVYTIKAGKKKPKYIQSKAHIFFDTNEPVVTKASKIRLKRAHRLTLEAGLVMPDKTAYWAPIAPSASLENKFIGIGFSRLLPKRLLNLDWGLRYSRSDYKLIDRPIEPGVSFNPYTFQHLTLHLTPQLDVLPWLRLGLGGEAGLVLSGDNFGRREYSLSNTDNSFYSPLRWGGTAHVLIGNTRKSGVAVGVMYYRFNEKLPILSDFNTGDVNWHGGLRLFLRYKM